MGLTLGPAGIVDLCLGDSGWLLDGPESFFRPFTAGLRRTPQEERRAWLLGRLLNDEGARSCVADFFPPAAAWPLLAGPRRLHWLEWGQTPAAARKDLLGLGRP
uniref:Uncharacterized protein n=1 Tax=Alexandrium catenella TaxID=2925 RepID=A0A7S1LF30_ALECA